MFILVDLPSTSNVSTPSETYTSSGRLLRRSCRITSSFLHDDSDSNTEYDSEDRGLKKSKRARLSAGSRRTSNNQTCLIRRSTRRCKAPMDYSQYYMGPDSDEGMSL